MAHGPPRSRSLSVVPVALLGAVFLLPLATHGSAFPSGPGEAPEVEIGGRLVVEGASTLRDWSCVATRVLLRPGWGQSVLEDPRPRDGDPEAREGERPPPRAGGPAGASTPLDATERARLVARVEAARAEAARAEAGSAWTENGPGGPPELLVSVPEMDCGGGTINRHMREAMAAATHPWIRFALVDLASTSTGLRLEGTLEIRGQTRNLVLPTEVRLEESRPPGAGGEPGPGVPALRLRGETTLDMTEWGVEPPTVLLGRIRVRDSITLRWDLPLLVEVPDSRGLAADRPGRSLLAKGHPRP